MHLNIIAKHTKCVQYCHWVKTVQADKNVYLSPVMFGGINKVDTAGKREITLTRDCSVKNISVIILCILPVFLPALVFLSRYVYISIYIYPYVMRYTFDGIAKIKVSVSHSSNWPYCMSIRQTY